MKLCPKCNIEHNKPGTFCSRTCANSRTFSAITTLKRSKSNKDAIALFTDEKLQDIKTKRLATYRKNIIVNSCTKCNMPLKKNKHGLCWTCYIQSDIATDVRGHHSKNYKRLSVIDSNGNSMLLMSSMEIDYHDYLVKNKIHWTKPSLLSYKDSTDKIRWYRPDFYLTDTKEVIEIKGYWWNNDKIKMQLVIEQNPDVNIKIIMKEELKRIIGDKSIGADIGL